MQQHLNVRQNMAFELVKEMFGGFCRGGTHSTTAMILGKEGKQLAKLAFQTVDTILDECGTETPRVRPPDRGPG